MPHPTAHESANQTVNEGVRHAIAAYCQALDDGRVDDLLQLFTADGRSALPGREVVAGHDALRRMYQALVPNAPQRHLVFNTVVTHRDDGHAFATSDLMFLTRNESGWTTSLVGKYEDLLVRDESLQWRFEQRSLTFTTP